MSNESRYPTVDPLSSFGRTPLFRLLSNLPRPTLGLVIFLVGMHLKYFLPLLIPASREFGSGSGTFRFKAITYFLLFAGAFIETRKADFWWLRRHSTWTMFTFLSLGLTAAVTLITGGARLATEGPLIYIVEQQLPFLWMLVVPFIAMRAVNWMWILVTIAGHAMFGSLYALHTIFIQGVTTRTDLLIENEFYQYFMAGLYMTALLLMLLPSFRGIGFKGTAIFAYLVSCLQSFIAAKRYPLMIIPVELIFLCYGFARATRAGGMIVYALLCALLIGALVMCFEQSMGSAHGANVSIPLYQEAKEQLLKRMEGGDVRRTVVENARWYETRAAMDSMDWIDWIVGKGFISPWKDPAGMYDHDRYGLHNSFVNAFYWGGIPLFIVLMTPLVWAWRAFRRSPDPVVVGCAAFMLLVYIRFPAYVIYTDSLLWLLFCLAIGRIAWTETIEPGGRIPSGERQSFCRYG